MGGESADWMVLTSNPGKEYRIMKTYIVKEYRKDRRAMCYVAARPGWYRSASGEQLRDESARGPEHTWKREHALEFASRRAAARVAALCPGSEVSEA